MTKKFLTSVANAYMYDDSNGDLLAVGKTLLDSSIETTLGKTDVRAGRGNQLQYVYYHTGEMNVTISDAQWNLGFLSLTVGSDIVTGSNIYTEETITLGAAGTGTVLGTPLAVTGVPIYGWVTQLDGTTDKVTFSGQTFPTSNGTSGDEVCVRYYALDSAARSVTIDANMIPKIVRLVLEAQLNSSDDTTTNQIGYAQIIIPKASLSGAFSIKMTPDGVASTPLTARALASEDADSSACDSSPYYAKIVEIISGAAWWDDVIGIAIEGGDFTQTDETAGTQLKVWAIPSTGLPFRAPVGATPTGVSGYMTFSSGTVGTATITSGQGIITGVTGGTTLLHATITEKPAIDASVLLTLT
jgi:hypothetical protein